MPWNYRPWGCGSGRKGSCNNGWIQFEICEGNLDDKDYFEKVYKEACEITAYLCNLYNLNPKGTVTVNGTKVPVILCHQDSYKLGFGSNHGDIYHWFKKHGKDMDDVRNDVAELMKDKTTTSQITPVVKPSTSKTLYRVRKNWQDIKSQIGAYDSLENAKMACDKAGSAYRVFNASGKVVYPTKSTFSSYKVKITASTLNVRNGAGTKHKINTTVKKGEIYTIVAESNGWGKLKSGAGWISLAYTKKV